MVLNSDCKTRKKALVDRQGHRNGERLVERPWLQLMCCVPVSGREVGHIERVQKGIAHWDKQNNNVPAPNCVLKVREEIIKDEGL